MISQFLTKQGEAAICIAKCFLELGVGDRIPNLSDMSAQFGFGSGTVQSTMKMLEAEKVIMVQSRGHQGSTLEFIDRVSLWKLVDFPWVSGAMPLPYTSRLEGLATALYRQFEQKGMQFSLQFIRGGAARIKRLDKEAIDFVICSKNAAQLAEKDFQDLEILFDFGPGSYMDCIGVVFADPNNTKIKDGMKIGIDMFSYDHKYLNECLCSGIDVSFVEVKYSELFTKLSTHEIDASLWNWDELKAKFDKWNILQLSDGEVSHSVDAATAVLLTRTPNKRLRLLLSETIDMEDLLSTQNGVVDKMILPSY